MLLPRMRLDFAFLINSVLGVLLLLGSFSPALATSAKPVPELQALSATSYLLADFDSGRVIVEKDIDNQIEPASITKIMTAYVLYQALAEGTINRSDMVTISEKAWRMEGSRMFIEVNKQVSVADLIKGLIIQSGNDASVALAEHVAGSESAFVSMMNTQAERMGMTGTQYRNSTGWPDPDHYTTARDIFTLTTNMIRDFPDEYKTYSEREFTYNGISQSNRNRLLWLDESADGVKTGHTESAGFCLVGSAKREGMRLIAVVLGTDHDRTRVQHVRTLLNYGFRFFETRKLYSSDDSLADVRVWKGTEKTVGLGVDEDIYVTFKRGHYNDLKVMLDRPKSLQAPLLAGQNIGQLRVTLEDETVYSAPLLAKKQVAESGFLSKMWDNVLLMFE